MTVHRECMTTEAGKSITLVHFVYWAEDSEAVDGWRIACMPGMREFHTTLYHPNYPRTNDPRAVSCPMCQATIEFKDAIKTGRISVVG